jgi:hypothetical protein
VLAPWGSWWVYLASVELTCPSCAGAVLRLVVAIPVARREEVLVPTPEDGRRHHSTAPAGELIGCFVAYCSIPIGYYMGNWYAYVTSA